MDILSYVPLYPPEWGMFTSLSKLRIFRGYMYKRYRRTTCYPYYTKLSDIPDSVITRTTTDTCTKFEHLPIDVIAWTILVYVDAFGGSRDVIAFGQTCRRNRDAARIFLQYLRTHLVVRTCDIIPTGVFPGGMLSLVSVNPLYYSAYLNMRDYVRVLMIVKYCYGLNTSNCNCAVDLIDIYYSAVNVHWWFIADFINSQLEKLVNSGNVSLWKHRTTNRIYRFSLARNHIALLVYYEGGPINDCLTKPNPITEQLLKEQDVSVLYWISTIRPMLILHLFYSCDRRNNMLKFDTVMTMYNCTDKNAFNDVDTLRQLKVACLETKYWNAHIHRYIYRYSKFIRYMHLRFHIYWNMITN